MTEDEEAKLLGAAEAIKDVVDGAVAGVFIVLLFIVLALLSQCHSAYADVVVYAPDGRQIVCGQTGCVLKGLERQQCWSHPVGKMVTTQCRTVRDDDERLDCRRNGPELVCSEPTGVIHYWPGGGSGGGAATEN